MVTKKRTGKIEEMIYNSIAIHLKDWETEKSKYIGSEYIIRPPMVYVRTHILGELNTESKGWQKIEA